MAHITYNVGVHRVIHKFEDVQADFPANGLITTDETVVFIDATPGNVDIQVTYDSIADINGGTAAWYTIKTVGVGTSEATELTDYGPTGVKLVAASAGDIAWVTC